MADFLLSLSYGVTFDPKGIKSTPSDFHEDTLKSVGGVREIPMPEIAKNALFLNLQREIAGFLSI